MSQIYQHTQSTAATTWTITHNMGGPVISDVIVTFNGAVVKVLPKSVVYTDDNTLTVTFNSATTGSVRIIGPYQPAVLTGPGNIDG